jgi:hypothetical protein
VERKARDLAYTPFISRRHFTGQSKGLFYTKHKFGVGRNKIWSYDTNWKASIFVRRHKFGRTTQIFGHKTQTVHKIYQMEKYHLATVADTGKTGVGTLVRDTGDKVGWEDDKN